MLYVGDAHAHPAWIGRHFWTAAAVSAFGVHMLNTALGIFGRTCPGDGEFG